LTLLGGTCKSWAFDRGPIPEGSGIHFKIVALSGDIENIRLLQRPKKVNWVLGKEQQGLCTLCIISGISSLEGMRDNH